MDELASRFATLNIKDDAMKYYLTHGVQSCGHYKHWPNLGFGKLFSFYKNALPLLKKSCKRSDCVVCPIVYGSKPLSNPWRGDGDYDADDENSVKDDSCLEESAAGLSLSGLGQDLRYDEDRDTVYDFSFTEKRFIAKESIDHNFLTQCNAHIETAQSKREETFTIGLVLKAPWTTQLLRNTGLDFYDSRSDFMLSDTEYEIHRDANLQTGADVTPEITLQVCDRVQIYLDAFADFREMVKPYLSKVWLKCVKIVHFEAPAELKGQAIALKLVASPNMRHLADTLASVLAQPRYLTSKIENYPTYERVINLNKDTYFATVAYVPKNDPFNRDMVKSFFNSIVGQYFECSHWHMSMDQMPVPRPYGLDEFESLCH